MYTHVLYVPAGVFTLVRASVFSFFFFFLYILNHFVAAGVCSSFSSLDSAAALASFFFHVIENIIMRLLRVYGG